MSVIEEARERVINSLPHYKLQDIFETLLTIGDYYKTMPLEEARVARRRLLRSKGLLDKSIVIDGRIIIPALLVTKNKFIVPVFIHFWSGVTEKPEIIPMDSINGILLSEYLEKLENENTDPTIAVFE